jgi:UDP-GlcNAc:undecaprenyl-phosphate/decaprenyl-phosphate GlcNAc-1-phosphate transferase
MLMTGLSIALVFGVSLVALILVTRLGYARGGDDKQSIRNVHSSYTPRVGGIGIFAAMLVALPFVGFIMGGFELPTSEALATYFGIFVAAALLFAVGLADDLFTVSHRWKLMAQIFAAEALVATGTIIPALDFGPLGVLSLGWLAAPFTLVFIVGLINAMNMVDGLDGLAAGLAFVALAACVFMLSRAGDFNFAKSLFLLMVGLVAFLSFNFHPARIFLGDAGSLTIGVLVATGVIHAFQTPAGGVATPAFLLPVFIPILDTLAAMTRRFIAGMSLFEADRDHIHHRIFQRTQSQTKTVLLMWAAAAALGLSAILITRGTASFKVLGTLLTLGSTGFLVWLSDLHVLFNPAYVFGRLRRHRTRNKRLRTGVSKLVARLKEAESMWEVNHMLVNLVSMLGCSSFSIGYETGERGAAQFTWVSSRYGELEPSQVQIDEFPLRQGGEKIGTLRAGWPKEQVGDLFEKRLLTEQLAAALTISYREVALAQDQPAA